MLRIFTFLRNAFERPPEREGRELFARIRDPLSPSSSVPPDAEPTPSPSGEEGDDESRPEAPSTEKESPTDTVTRETREDTGQALEKQESLPKARALREQMDEALRLINHPGFAKALDGIQKSERNKRGDKQDPNRRDCADRVRDVAAYCYHERNIVSHLGNEADTIERFQKGDLTPGDFVRWMCTLHEEDPTMDATRLALEQELQSIERLDPDIDTKWLNADPDDEEFEKKKEKIIKRLYRIADGEGRRKTITGELTEYAQYLDPTLKNVQDMRKGFEEDNKAYWDEMKQIFSPIGFLKEGWENAMSILAIPTAMKKIWEAYKKKWELKKSTRAAKIAYGAAKFIPDRDLHATLQQELQTADKKTMEEAKIRLTGKKFEDMKKELLMINASTPPGETMAILEEMARNGWLYDITPAGDPRQTSFFGKEIGAFLPDYVTAKTITDIITANTQAGEKREKEGYDFASQHGKAWQMVPHIRTALQDHDYHRARGILKRAINKGDLGHTPTWATMMIINMLRDAKECGYMNTELIKSFGDMVVKTDCGAPQSWLLLTTKFLAAEYTKLAGKGAGPGELFLTDPEKGRPIAAAIVKAEELICTHGGPLIDKTEQTYIGPTQKEKIEYAVAKLLAGTVVRLADGTAIDLHDDLKEFQDYRTLVEQSYRQYPARVNISAIDLDYTSTTCELHLLNQSVLTPLFQAKTDGTLQAYDKTDGLFKAIAAEAERKRNYATPAAYTTYINELKKRLLHPLINFLIHKQSHNEVENLKFLPEMVKLGILPMGEIPQEKITDEMRLALGRMGIL